MQKKMNITEALQWAIHDWSDWSYNWNNSSDLHSGTLQAFGTETVIGYTSSSIYKRFYTLIKMAQHY